MRTIKSDLGSFNELFKCIFLV
uniref:Uncharacterized protein n=1 Tax=Lepeophtheirus salmonis TaxID=72036 RepID=A0A0K2SV19_LEPSM